MLIKNDFFHGQTYVRLFFSPCLGPRVTWCQYRPLIGRERSREQIDDVSYANESRDPPKQWAMYTTDPVKSLLRASLCKILISSFAYKMDFADNFSVDFF